MVILPLLWSNLLQLYFLYYSVISLDQQRQKCWVLCNQKLFYDELGLLNKKRTHFYLWTLTIGCKHDVKNILKIQYISILFSDLISSFYLEFEIMFTNADVLKKFIVYALLCFQGMKSIYGTVVIHTCIP